MTESFGTKRWLEAIVLAVVKDLPGMLNLSIMDQTSFESCIPPNREMFFVLGSDDSRLSLECNHPFAIALGAMYRGPDTRSSQSTSSTFVVVPTSLLVLPPYVLTGHPEWTREKVNGSKLLSSCADRRVKYEVGALHEGMKNAILQGHHDALLTLIWFADRRAEFARGASKDPY